MGKIIIFAVISSYSDPRSGHLPGRADILGPSPARLQPPSRSPLIFAGILTVSRARAGAAEFCC